MAKKNKQKEHRDVRWAWATVGCHCSFHGDVESMQNDMWEMLKASVTHKEDYYEHQTAATLYTPMKQWCTCWMPCISCTCRKPVRSNNQ